jgi:tetratricopeptide (TPR) repeat protein
MNSLGPGYFHDASELCNRAIEIRAVKFSKRSAILTYSLYNRAQILRDSNFLKDAHRHYEQALHFAKQHYTEDCILYALIQCDFGECYRLEGEYQQAEQVLKDGIALLRNHFESRHWKIASAILYLAILLLDMGNYIESLSLLEQHVTPILEESLGYTCPLTVYSRGVTGMCLKLARKIRGDAQELSTLPIINDESVEDAAGSMKEAEGNNNNNDDGPPVTSNMTSPPGTANSNNNNEVAQYSQDLIDDALEFFDGYDQGPFDDAHPWVSHLGGFITPSVSRASTANQKGGELTARSRLGTAGTPSRPATSGVALQSPVTSLFVTEADENGSDDELFSRPFTAQSYAASRPTTTGAALGHSRPNTSHNSAWMDNLLTTESELEAGGGFATRPKTQGNE